MMIHFETNQIDIWQEKMLIPLSIKITAELAGLGVLLCLYSKWKSDTRNTTTLTHSYKRALIKKQTHYWKCNYRIRLLSLNLHKNTSGNTFWTKLAPNLLVSDPALCSMRNTFHFSFCVWYFIAVLKEPIIMERSGVVDQVIQYNSKQYNLYSKSCTTFVNICALFFNIQPSICIGTSRK